MGFDAAAAPNLSALGIQRKYSYDRASQLTDIGDSRRGGWAIATTRSAGCCRAQSQMSAGTFAFDPASNVLDPMASAARRPGAINNIPAILNNLVKDLPAVRRRVRARP